MKNLKICELCGCDSSETAIFTCTYAKGELNVCLACLAEGIMDVLKEYKNPNIKTIKATSEPININLIDFEVQNEPQDVFGFNCEKCGNILFTSKFPVICECGHENKEIVLEKQNMNLKK